MLWREPPGCVSEPGDVLVRVDVGHNPMTRFGKQPDWWDLGGRVESAEVAGKATCGAQPDRPPYGGCVLRLFCPGHGMGDRETLGPHPVEVGGELLDHLALVSELVTHRPPCGQVVGGGDREVRHRSAPGQGIASSRNAR